MNAAEIKQREQDALKGKLILDWLMFEPRVDWAEQQALLAAASPISCLDPLTTLQAHSGAAFPEVNARSAFIRYIENTHLHADQHMAREDVQAILDQIATALRQQGRKSRLGLSELLRQLIRLFAIEIYIENSSVRVALHSLRGWHQVTDRIDAEALLCLRLAELGFSREIAELDQWTLVTLVCDRDVDALVADGVSDMHQHLGGLRSAHVIWLRLMTGDLRPDQIPYFDRFTLTDLEADPTAHRRRLAERDRIERLALAHRPECDATLWRYFFAPLGQLRSCHSPPREGPRFALDDVTTIGNLILRERIMLARGFERLLELANLENTPDREVEACRLEHALDLYIHTKSRFVSNHRQAVRSNPGLGRHRQFADSTKVAWGWDVRWDRRRRIEARSAEARSYDHSEAVYFLLQSPALDRVELRLAPAERSEQYTRFLETWARVEKRMKAEGALPAGRIAPDIRFSIHFKRSLDRRVAGEASRMQAFLQELDAHSAALHEFRLDMHADSSGGGETRPIVARIARIDFAGQERDIFPDRAAFAMNLLRGDEQAFKRLCGANDIQPSAEYHGRWLELKDRNGLHMPARLPRLGITCHAGEDYAHPLEGLHAMITAVEALNMRAGDSIGHGLAIGRDVAQFHREIAHRLTTAKGAQFDALTWLHATLIAKAPPDHMQAVARIDAWLWRQVMEIYPRQLQPMSLTSFLDVAHLRRGPVPDRKRHPPAIPGQIWWSECWCESVRQVRDSREPLANILYEIEPSIIWAQEYVAREIARRGVIIELNPSSNWRISQARAPKDIPFVAILIRFGAFIIACINTDNAGAYGTRIENEYAIALTGLTDSGMSRTEAIALLDRMRITGLSLLH